MFVWLGTVLEEAERMRTIVRCLEAEKGQTDLGMPSVLSLSGYASSTGTSCWRSDLFVFALCRRFVAAAIRAFCAGSPCECNGERSIGSLSSRLSDGPLKFLRAELVFVLTIEPVESGE
jgi:hypothetical protein